VSRERVHSLTGVLPLGAYLVLHIFEASAAVDGRQAFADSMSGLGGGQALILEGLLVLLPLLVHAALGFAIWARPSKEPASTHPSPAFRNIQRVTGVLVLVFLAFHLAHTFVLEMNGADAGALYDRLRIDMGTPLHLGVYVIGTAAVALHLALGLPSAARRFGLVGTEAAQKSARVASAGLAIVLFAMSINAMSHFVVGDAFVGGDVEASR